MLANDFSFDLPDELIARYPPPSREDARLMILDRTSGELRHRTIADVADELPERSLLVFNDTRVRPARISARRSSGGETEMLFLRPLDDTARKWHVLVPRLRRLSVGAVFDLPAGRVAHLLEKREEGAVVTLNESIEEWYFDRYGAIPLPPYLRRPAEHGDTERYQTTFAAKTGSVAAPTAGLHFTPRILDSMKASGHDTAYVTLHVGMGTFLPMRNDRVEDHRMHWEEYELPSQTVVALNRAVAEERPIVAVGTTVVRVLESAAAAAVRTGGRAVLWPHQASTRLFIRPGFRFRLITAMLTNFHTPKSTLLVLVSAFAGRDRILSAYREAVRLRYRFFSYGDATLLL